MRYVCLITTTLLICLVPAFPVPASAGTIDTLTVHLSASCDPFSCPVDFFSGWLEGAPVSGRADFHPVGEAWSFNFTSAKPIYECGAASLQSRGLLRRLSSGRTNSNRGSGRTHTGRVGMGNSIGQRPRERRRFD